MQRRSFQTVKRKRRKNLQTPGKSLKTVKKSIQTAKRNTRTVKNSFQTGKRKSPTAKSSLPLQRRLWQREETSLQQPSSRPQTAGAS